MPFLKILKITIVLVLLGALCTVALEGCNALYKGPPSDHFDGLRFFNKEPDHTFTDMLKWLWEMETVIIEMDWWQEYILRSADVKITFVHAQHNSGRDPFRKNRTLWGGFIIGGSDGKIYFAGDTGYGQFLNSIKDRFAHFRLTIFPIGSYEKRWFMKTQHMNPDDAVKAHKLLESEQSIGIHFGTFLEHPEQLIDEHEKDLLAALNKYKVLESEFWILKFGEGRYVPK